jgi:PAS domain S-box-containing protein
VKPAFPSFAWLELVRQDRSQGRAMVVLGGIFGGALAGALLREALDVGLLRPLAAAGPYLLTAGVLLAALVLAAQLAPRLAGERGPGMGAALLLLPAIAAFDIARATAPPASVPVKLFCGVLLALLVAAFLWLPRLLRRHPSPAAESLWWSLPLHAAAQAEMLILAGDTPLAGALPRLFALLLPLAHYFAADLRRRRNHDSKDSEKEIVVRELHSRTHELRTKTEELQRLDVERLRGEEERQRAERNLSMLAKAVETMSLGVTITDMKNQILYVNPADARLHGYSVAELIGQDSRIYGAEDGVPAEPSVAEPWARERINVTKQGERVPVRLVSDRVRNSDGEPIATVTICEDIRERLRTREALERRDHILEAVGFAAEKFLAQSSWAESVEEVLVRLGEVTGVDHVSLEILDVNDPLGRDAMVFAWPPPGQSGRARSALELPARWEHMLLAGETVEGRRAGLPPLEQEALEERGVESLAVVPLFVRSTWRGFLALEAKDPARQWSVAEREALKTAARTLGASVQRHEDEEALARSEAKYRELLESANDLVQSVAPDGRFQFVNRAWKSTLGYGDDEIPNLTIWEVVRPAPPDSKRDVLQSMLIDDGLGRIEALFVAKDGKEIAVEGTVTCRYVDGLPVAAQGIFRDITERRQIDRMKTEFLSTVSHELRTPLTSIIASLGLLESGRLAGNPQRVQELIQVAHRNSNRLLKLINNLLDLQKIAARKMTFKNDAIEVQALLEEAIRSLVAYADSLEIELELMQGPPLLRVFGDRDRLMQVLHNLLSNAIKFSPPRERVILEARRHLDKVILVVADNGPGIPEEFRSRIFDQFSQADTSKTRVAGGSGLGLSIAKGLVEGMKGTIKLDTLLGVGTNFYVELPAAPDAAAPAETSGESGVWPRFAS